MEFQIFCWFKQLKTTHTNQLSLTLGTPNFKYSKLQVNNYHNQIHPNFQIHHRPDFQNHQILTLQ